MSLLPIKAWLIISFYKQTSSEHSSELIKFMAILHSQPEFLQQSEDLRLLKHNSLLHCQVPIAYTLWNMKLC